MKPELILLPGPVGQLEALVLEVPGSSHCALICHPHPLYQGSMHNKVVTTLAKAFELAGVSTVRFNYRGVGNSDGAYGDIVGEIDDALAMRDYMQQRFAAQSLCLAGFSFGSFIAGSLADRGDCALLVTVAPAVTHADFDALTNIQCPWLVAMGEQDELVSFEQVKSFVEHPPSALQFVSFAKASHFFHGQLIPLREKAFEFIQSIVQLD